MEKLLVLFDLDYTLFDTDLFKKSGLTEYKVYPEAVKVLEMLQGKVRLGIFSEGEQVLQNEKIRKTNIGNFFNNNDINIVLNKREMISKIFEKYKDNNIFLVDDRKDMLRTAKEVDSLVTTI